MNSHLIHHSGQVNDYVIGNSWAHEPKLTTNWAHEVRNLSLSAVRPFYKKAFVTRCEFTRCECKPLIGISSAYNRKSTINWARDLNTSGYPIPRQCLIRPLPFSGSAAGLSNGTHFIPEIAQVRGCTRTYSLIFD